MVVGSSPIQRRRKERATSSGGGNTEGKEVSGVKERQLDGPEDISERFCEAGKYQTFSMKFFH